MTGIARPAAPWLLGVDSYSPISLVTARAVAAAGYRWVGRYLENLTASEALGLLGADLGIAPLMMNDTRVLTAAVGHERGASAVARAKAIGVPAGVHVTVDVEAVQPGADPDSYASAVANELAAGGHEASAYGGMPFPAVDWGKWPQDRYWRGGGAVPEPHCGFCVLQLPPLDTLVINGQKFDVNVTCQDFLGRAMTWWWPS